MEPKLDYAWLSDPLIEYAFYLSCMLFVVILTFILIIVKKYYQRQHELHCQQTLQNLLDRTLQYKQSKSKQLEIINSINVIITKNHLDAICAWSSILESAESIARKNYIEIFLKLNYFKLLSDALNGSNLKAQCLAIQLIGICKLKEFTPILKKYIKTPVLSSYVSIALSRIQGIQSIDIVIKAFEGERITTSQLLSAFVEMPKKDLEAWQIKQRNSSINKLISQYL